jgi:hypothetical protein
MRVSVGHTTAEHTGMGDDTRHTIQPFWHTANTRDRDTFAALLHPEVVDRVSQTDERTSDRLITQITDCWPSPDEPRSRVTLHLQRD